VFWPLLRKDFLSIGLFVFSVCFASFSIPLVVGGGRGTTLEVLIYEKIRLSSDWGAALFLSLLQSAILWTMSLAVRPHRLTAETRKSNFKIIESSFGLLVFICVMCAYFIGYGQGLLESMTKFNFIVEVWDSFWRAFFGSWLLGVLAGGLTLLLLLSLLWLNSEGWFDRFFAGYWAPSTSLTGFAFLLIAPNEGIYAYFKIAFAFVVLNLNSFYRMGWQKNIQELKKSREVATVLGAARKTIFFRIELPQVFKRACFFSGLMAVWMVGDFGLSRILAYKDFSLALMSETYLSSYRMAEATLLSFFVLIVGLLVLTIFWSLSYVYDRKFKLSL
jgi:thiamine transport system permease protein